MNNDLANNISDDIEIVPVNIELLEDGVLPRYSNPGDAGMDVYAAENVYIYPGQTVKVRTGFKVAIPAGYELQVRPRSGISLNTPLRVSNAPGTIDSGFRDEVQILITNTSSIIPEHYSDYHLNLKDKDNKKGTYVIYKNDRIAQLVLQKVPKADFIIVDSVADIGENRGGGFGHTGVK